MTVLGQLIPKVIGFNPDKYKVGDEIELDGMIYERIRQLHGCKWAVSMKNAQCYKCGKRLDISTVKDGDLLLCSGCGGDIPDSMPKKEGV